MATEKKVEDFRNEIGEPVEGGDAHDFGRTGSTFGAFFNVVCIIAGTGTLGLPNTLAVGGWVSLIFIVLSAAIAWYTGNLLIECLYYKPGKRLSSYPDVGEEAFGKVGRVFVQFFHYAIMLGASCLFILLTGLNLTRMFATYDIALDMKLMTLVGGVLVLIPYSLFKNMREVSFLSVFGALATLVVIVVTVVTGVIDIPNQTDAKHDNVLWEGIPIALATISFSYGGNVVYPHVEASMKNPKAWRKMLFSSMVTVSVFYIIISVVGYYVYGRMVESPVLNSIPQGVANVVATAFITFHVIAAAPILLCGFSLEMENSFNINRDHMGPIKEFVIRFSLRVLITGILTVIAVYVPYFGDFMSLVGALANCMIVFVIPVICHLKLYGWRDRKWYEYIWMFIVIVVGLIGCILGAIDAIKSLAAHFAADAKV
ncbi:hypothetical protein K502DRAFT_324180 [Neoconidiobolus thromboides FSU 785]|nr:hypothetical protein K502DRAFT_324180 [Neoconidiobolus thromboides FSU 785]